MWDQDATLLGWTCGNLAARASEVAAFFWDLLVARTVVSPRALAMMADVSPLSAGWAKGYLSYGTGLMLQQTSLNGTRPPVATGRLHFAVALDAAASAVYVLGGQQGSAAVATVYRDVWRYDGASWAAVLNAAPWDARAGEPFDSNNSDYSSSAPAPPAEKKASDGGARRKPTGAKVRASPPRRPSEHCAARAHGRLLACAQANGAVPSVEVELRRSRDPLLRM